MVLKDSLPGEDRRHRPRYAEANGGAVAHVLPVLGHANHAVGGLDQLLIANVKPRFLIKLLKKSLPGEHGRHRPRHAEANGGTVAHVLPVLGHAVDGLDQLPSPQPHPDIV